ncbi:MAG TPA: IS630 family transposase [Candidatus Limnocylindria bacterium]|nr:IS630 family transposase [Candidatus Limnocylindria bacterium]
MTTSQRRTLKARDRGHKTPLRDWQRAHIVLLAARGYSNAGIARRTHVTIDTVRTWRDRFANEGMDGLNDRPRSGRPRIITALQRAEICALACHLPAVTGVPLSRWSTAELQKEILAAGIITGISYSSIRRILAEHPIKPWQYESWIFPRDPDFVAKASVILDLYAGFYQGLPLGPGDRIISIDAKPSIQARHRLHPISPSGFGTPMRVEHEYERRGALALLAALDTRDGTIAAARTPPTVGIVPFMALIGEVMSQDAYADANRVFIIVDNGSDHRGQASIDRLTGAYPNCILIHTPVHASWLNQVEIFFSIIQRKVLTPNDFADTGQLAATLMSFADRYNATARPFNWRYTTADLERHLARIPEPPTVPVPASQPILLEAA